LVTNRKFAVGSECRTLLEEAANKHLPLTITNKQDNSWQVYKSTFYAIKSHRIIVSLPVPEISDCHLEPAAGQEIAVAFKKGYHKCLFVTRIVAQEPYELDAGVSAPSMTLLVPEQIEKLQRRAYNRTKVPTGESIPVSFWKNDHSDQEIVWEGTLSDLSAGGVGVRMRKSDIVDLEPGQQFIIQFVPLTGYDPLRLSASFRHVAEIKEDDQVTLGFKLVGLEMDEGGRHMLRQISRIVNVYQRRQPISEHSGLSR
jgi:c-di-GMP-binding flagellar brake protein YcgR